MGSKTDVDINRPAPDLECIRQELEEEATREQQIAAGIASPAVRLETGTVTRSGGSALPESLNKNYPSAGHQTPQA